MTALPRPLAADALVAVDAAEWSLFVAPNPTDGYASLLRRQGIRALAEGRAGDVWAYVGHDHRLARGAVEDDGTLRFQWDYGDSVFRALAARPNLRAVVTVDREAGRILGVRFLGRGKARAGRVNVTAPGGFYSFLTPGLWIEGRRGVELITSFPVDTACAPGSAPRSSLTQLGGSNETTPHSRGPFHTRHGSWIVAGADDCDGCGL